jgi:hypothetical protein
MTMADHAPNAETLGRLKSVAPPPGVSLAGWVAFVEANIAAVAALAQSGYSSAGWIAFAEAEATAVAALLAS